MKNEEFLHRIVKEKMKDLQTDFRESDWKAMKRKLLIHKLLKFGVPTFIVFTGILTIFTLQPNEIKKQIAKIPYIIKDNDSEKLEEEINENAKITSITAQISENKKTDVSQTKSLETQNETPASRIENEISTIKSKGIVSSENHENNLVEREIRILSASAVSMSERISKVRELGKTFEMTSYNVLDRNIDRWKNVVIVCDITSSMFPYTTQVFDWLSKNKDNTSVKGIVFFTDCDSLGNQARKLPAKMFSVKNRDENTLWETMFAAIENSENNEDSPENNIEALLYAQKHFPDAQEIVLIADNSSTIKDMSLLSKLKKPVHVIACSETYIKNLAFQPDFVKIAKKTNGTIHTSEDDISDLSKIEEGIIVRVGKIFFRYHKGKFFATKFKIRP